jgi:hypothetical protein
MAAKMDLWIVIPPARRRHQAGVRPVAKGDRSHAIYAPESSRESMIFIAISASIQGPSHTYARIATKPLREQTPFAAITRWKMIVDKF